MVGLVVVGGGGVRCPSVAAWLPWIQDRCAGVGVLADCESGPSASACVVAGGATVQRGDGPVLRCWSVHRDGVVCAVGAGGVVHGYHSTTPATACANKVTGRLLAVTNPTIYDTDTIRLQTTCDTAANPDF